MDKQRGISKVMFLALRERNEDEPETGCEDGGREDRAGYQAAWATAAGAEDKIRIVLQGLRGEDSIAELCRKEGIHQNLYYRWSKEFLEAGRKRLAGDTVREATTHEVKELRSEAAQLKEALPEALLENRLLKKSVIAAGEDDI